MKNEFLRVARALNRAPGIVPLLFGSLGLEQRLGIPLNPDDIDVLVPDAFLHDRWPELESAMQTLGYTLYDAHEHAFAREGVSCAFAAVESLTPFAGVQIDAIEQIDEDGTHYLLLGLEDYRRVYAASAQDGYRKNAKHKDDMHKVALIDQRLKRGE